jgi:hypothetical protein
MHTACTSRTEESKLALCLAKHDAVKMYREWKYSFTHPQPWHKMEVSGRFHIPEPLPQEVGPLYTVNNGQDSEWDPEQA